MIEITNLQQTPISLFIRSKRAPGHGTSLTIPGIGAEKNIFYLEEERATEYINRAEQSGYIKTRFVDSNILRTGEKHGNT
jgi:hypothetical protein